MSQYCFPYDEQVAPGGVDPRYAPTRRTREVPSIANVCPSGFCNYQNPTVFTFYAGGYAS